MNGKLREIPDSVEEFTGFRRELMWQADFMGFGDGDGYYPTGSAQVRSVRLPPYSAHWTVTCAGTLLKEPATMNWISHYQPVSGNGQISAAGLDFSLENGKVLWVADVWHSIKKHWVLELQRLIRGRTTPSL